MKRVALALAVFAATGATAGAQPAASRLTVFAAASMTRVLPHIDAKQRYQFAGSNTLALQIEQGAPVDVFVSASPRYIVELQSKGLLVGKPAWILSNRIVLIVPRTNPAHITAPADLTRPGVRLVIAATGVPAGDYARKSLAGMKLDAALQNVVSNEPDVEGVVAKVASGDADAGFVYQSDARAVGSRVKLVPLPGAGRFTTVYGAAVVKGTRNVAAARAYVTRLLGAHVQAQLRKAGFGARPRSAK
jgi:molybdate transport system substrate-binding protein